MQGLIGKKVGMTRVFNADSGEVVPVTIIQAGMNTIQQIKTMENDGYAAVQLGFDVYAEKKAKKPQLGHFKKNNSEPTRVTREFELDSDDEKLTCGQKIGVELFNGIKYVDVVGTSKGRGFAGTVKRYGFQLGRRTHGNTNRREGGSVGSNTYPARIKRGKRMAGHYGNAQVTTKALKVVKLDTDNGLLYIKGSVPGSSRGIVFVKKNMKVQ